MVVLDQLPYMIPLFKLFGIKVLYYCHFPEAYLCDYEKLSKPQYYYRKIIDRLEKWSINYADKICSNSEFSKENVIEFCGEHLRNRIIVLYPCVSLNCEIEKTSGKENNPGLKTKYFLSLNRFETRKNVSLALKSFARIMTESSFKTEQNKYELVLAGGFNDKNIENVNCLKELKKLASNLNISDKVKYHFNFNDQEKMRLIKNSICLLYTPCFEHFGIVPCEAMILGVPVIAINHGGPTETIIHSKTGFLLENDEVVWANHMNKLGIDDNLRNKMGDSATIHVNSKFGFESFSKNSIEILKTLLNKKSNKMG